MNERIQKYLDGELAREDLTVAELRAAETADAVFRAVARTARPDRLPSQSAAVMARIAEAERASEAGSIGSWLWRPRPLSIAFRPAYGLAAAALLAVLVGIRAPSNGGEVAAPMARTSGETKVVLVEFRLEAPAAQRVELAGNFTNWKPAYNLKRGGRGVWTIVVPMQPGVHDYAFIVDGRQWIPDPAAPTVDDGFGGLNSRMAVLSPEMKS